MQLYFYVYKCSGKQSYTVAMMTWFFIT